VNQIWIETGENTEGNKKSRGAEELKLQIEKALKDKFSEEMKNPIMVEIMRIAKNILERKILTKKVSNEIPRFSANNSKY
jgi:hypothetical protein